MTLGDLQNVLSKLSFGGKTRDANISKILKSTNKDKSSDIAFDVSILFRIMMANLCTVRSIVRECWRLYYML